MTLSKPVGTNRFVISEKKGIERETSGGVVWLSILNLFRNQK
jgi:hypothetical protein